MSTYAKGKRQGTLKMGKNCHALIAVLEAQDTPLDERFLDARVVNRDRSNGDPVRGGGILSVVFKANDSHTGTPVAIKFFDPDHQGPRATYRAELFQREAGLLHAVRGNTRCLQLVQGLREFDLTLMSESAGLSITIPCQYFVTEWLDHDINAIFYAQETFDAGEKLALFRNLSLAVTALHNAAIVHRDLKPDNLRCRDPDIKSMIVPIDFGTAASFDHQSLGSTIDYQSGPVGAPGFAPLEARFGLSGIRVLGRYSDYYALGCMFHDLFNTEFFFHRQWNDAGYQACLAIFDRYQTNLHFETLPPEEALGKWHELISAAKRQVNIPSMEGPHTSLPASIKPVSEQLLRMLTAVDYRDRLSEPTKLVRLIDAMIRILQNQRAAQRELDRRRALRRQRLLDLHDKHNSRSITGIEPECGDDANV